MVVNNGCVGGNRVDNAALSSTRPCANIVSTRLTIAASTISTAGSIKTHCASATIERGSCSNMASRSRALEITMLGGIDVDRTQLRDDGVKAVVVENALQLCSHVVVAGQVATKPEPQAAQIQPGPADHDRCLAACDNVVDRGVGGGDEHAGGHRRRQRIKGFVQMVWNSSSFVVVGARAGDGNPRVELTAVGPDNFAVDRFGQAQSEGAFA